MEHFMYLKRMYFYCLHRAAIATTNYGVQFWLHAMKGYKNRMVKAHNNIKNV